MTGNKRKKVELFDQEGNSRGYYDLRNQINDLTGKEWIFATKSVIPKNFPPSFQHDLRNMHGGQKPPELCESLIRTFTKEGDVVIDPFAGVGGTLLGCSLSHRKGIGIELNQEWIDIYNEVCKKEDLDAQEMHQGDAVKLLDKHFKPASADFILTDIPYWKMDKVEKSKGTYKKVGEEAKGIFSEKSKLSDFNQTRPSKTKDEWHVLLENVFTRCYDVLKPGKYCVVFIGNMYHDGKYHLLNADVAKIMESIGFVLKGEIVWYDVAKKLHLYGINYSWIPSIVHQFIMVFRKERNGSVTDTKKQEILKRNEEMVLRFGGDLP